ncbi:hypothetical protein A3B19_02105 [Candidatus Giovannonibacteria bacterium RIFCSPLOWO2_01_FULL_46_32]|uniref:Uncharacterized protein n=1 Tax=Candidatus Giovannonibacteria bacterium RIFCSPLOWO2_01_FULL_46_32 TaxID=1798353 RepID=A0A1F5XIF2_9BACT|nr:MAG: hypothetical protein A3B19_02105 [Candidatus Giovannonibacteria bacterium RIFCSPLOWO2_01_FULL_46_32]
MREHGVKEENIVGDRELNVSASEERRMCSVELNDVAKRQTLFWRALLALARQTGKLLPAFIIPKH